MSYVKIHLFKVQSKTSMNARLYSTDSSWGKLAASQSQQQREAQQINATYLKEQWLLSIQEEEDEDDDDEDEDEEEEGLSCPHPPQSETHNVRELCK